jgi:hypothetical protein
MKKIESKKSRDTVPLTRGSLTLQEELQMQRHSNTWSFDLNSLQYFDPQLP